MFKILYTNDKCDIFMFRNFTEKKYMECGNIKNL